MKGEYQNIFVELRDTRLPYTKIKVSFGGNVKTFLVDLRTCGLSPVSPPAHAGVVIWLDSEPLVNPKVLNYADFGFQSDGNYNRYGFIYTRGRNNVGDPEYIINQYCFEVWFFVGGPGAGVATDGGTFFLRYKSPKELKGVKPKIKIF